MMVVHYKSNITVRKSNFVHLKSKNKEANKEKQGHMIGISILFSKMAALKEKILIFLLKKKERKQLYSVLITKIKYF